MENAEKTFAYVQTTGKNNQILFPSIDDTLEIGCFQ